MNSTLFIQFTILNILNVIIQTVKSLATVKCGKTVAAIVNAIAYGLYTVVVVYTVCDLPLWLKVVVVGSCNLVGVFAVKLGEEKVRKDRLWKVELTVRNQKAVDFENDLIKFNIPYNAIQLDHWTLFNVYCATQKDSAFVKDVADRYKAKYFVTETKNL